MSTRKYTLNLNNIYTDSHAKYYWLGFLAADGNVAKNEARVRVELKDDDEAHLYKFLDFFDSNSPLTYRVNNKKCHCVCASINSSELKKYLANYNIIPAKTQTFKMPLDKIPQEFVWDFVRGLMDGDGCITLLYNTPYNPYAISFVAANIECVEQMKTLWEIDNKIVQNQTAFMIQKQGKDCIRILNKMYEFSTEETRLTRKYERYRSIVEQSTNEKSRELLETPQSF